jgi:hypothetical protein
MLAISICYMRGEVERVYVESEQVNMRVIFQFSRLDN